MRQRKRQNLPGANPMPETSMSKVTVIGAGLAGSEAAWQLVSRGIPVRIIEMRPEKKPGAFHTDGFAELVCSNSLRSDSLNNAVGILKEELRQDDVADTLYNIVGFQTHLTWPEQKRVFSMIPGLENARFVRYGVMHRNSYLPAKDVLLETYQSRLRPDLFFAGQLTGVEGYVESAASGLAAGINMARVLQGREPVKFGRQTALGAQAHYIANCEAKNLQPMNANFGIMVLEEPCHKRERKAAFARQSARRIREIREMLQAEDGEPERGVRKSAERE